MARRWKPSIVNLTASTDTTQAERLRERMVSPSWGITKGGVFDIGEAQALELLASADNPHGKPNSDIVVPWVQRA